VARHDPDNTRAWRRPQRSRDSTVGWSTWGTRAQTVLPGVAAIRTRGSTKSKHLGTDCHTKSQWRPRGLRGTRFRAPTAASRPSHGADLAAVTVVDSVDPGRRETVGNGWYSRRGGEHERRGITNRLAHEAFH